MQKAADASVVWLNSDAQIASFHYEDGYKQLNFSNQVFFMSFFVPPLTGVITNSGDTPTGYRVYDACRGSSVFRGCRLSISCCWLSTNPMPL